MLAQCLRDKESRSHVEYPFWLLISRGGLQCPDWRCQGGASEASYHEQDVGSGLL